MKIPHLVVGTFFLLMFAGSIEAASFDCGKASTEIEKLICSDDELSKLDESLSEAYLQALKRTDGKEQMIKNQRQWLKNRRNACKNAACIKKAYETRIKELASSSNGTAILTRPDGRTSPSGRSQVIERPQKAIQTETEQHAVTATVAEPVSGTYSRTDVIRDWGSAKETYGRAESKMILSMKDNDTFEFDLSIVGGNFHTCRLSGVAVRHRAFFEHRSESLLETPGECVLKFRFQGNSVRLEDDTGGCRGACGQRATFAGEVLYRSGKIPKDSRTVNPD